MGLIWTIIIGFIVGIVARFLMPGRDPMGFVFTTILGIVGAVLAAFLGRSLGWYGEGDPAGFLASVVGAMIVLFVARRVRGPVTR
ncbi:MAG: GlsB/YeaQ/YmgE family stress response membrane protein [Proteobacteria bacterium]|nr:MAG: GlsB/YeaQ/YmgE family stress response membrane protein [Pseudomonadota bacterium]